MEEIFKFKIDNPHPRRKKIIIGIITLTIIILAAGSFILFKSYELRKNILTENKPIISLTQKNINYLQRYSYFGKSPNMSFAQMAAKDQQYAKWIADTLFKVVQFDDNEKFFTNEKLVYITWDYNYAVRGVYQSKQQDGSIIEQDIEYSYGLANWSEDRSTVKLIYKGKRELSPKRVKKG